MRHITATVLARGAAATGIPAGTVLSWEEAKKLPGGPPGLLNFRWEVEATDAYRIDAPRGAGYRQGLENKKAPGVGAPGALEK